MNTTTRTGVEAIDCDNCGTPYLVDYDRHEVVLADEIEARSTHLDDDGLSFECLDCGDKVQA